ncbi:MAG: histidine kinase [Azospira oryzae]|jgi:CheY-like chemotaxis protein/signal transduction histidine kinase/CHASE3 domain sensor protein|nr:MAG: histidine kinase [Azospira oryzae]
MKTGLQTKILGGFIMCSLILLMVAIVSVRNSQKFTDANEWVNHTHEVLYDLEQTMISSLDAETGARGYVITGKAEYLTSFTTAEATLPSQIEELTRVVSDNPSQQKNIILLGKLSESHLAHLKKWIELRNTDATKASELVSTGESRRILNEIRELVKEARAIEQNLMVDRKQDSENDARSFTVIFSLLLAIIVIVLIVVYFIITTNLKALKKSQIETAAKNWTLAGTGELVKSMQGNKSMGELAAVIISRLAGYLGTPLAALYITENDNTTLHLAAAYSKSGKERDVFVPFGEGLVGQAAAEKKALVINNVNPALFKVNTSFGEVVPSHLLAFPLLFEDQVVGVIELGALKEIAEEQQDYLRVVSDSIAIAVISARSREEVRSLLEETQRQAEELEAQQEELRQSNEELHAKTDLLLQSEIELKMQQGELQAANTELEERATLLEQQKHKLEDAKNEIEHKAKEVEISSKYKSEFLANMSHELRTPLNSILILAQLLSENKHERLGDKEMEFARNIYTSGTGLLNLINEILDLSKIEAGKMELDIEKITVSEIVSPLTVLFSELAKDKDIRFVIDMDEEWKKATLSTDRQRVEQILRNLLSNAFKFTPKDGTVTLSVSRPQNEIALKNKNWSESTDRVAFRVADTGIGISEDKRALVFQAFQQADGSTKRKYGGTGLGLSISKELSHALGGEIGLESEEGKGSVFTLYLPVTFDPAFIVSETKRVEVKEKVKPSSTSIAKGKPSEDKQAANDDRNTIVEKDKVILIIEDDEKFANILLDFIREKGYKGIIATQGNTGLSYARYYQPVAVLLDMNLPVMDGNEVLRLIKNDPELRHIPVQIISAHRNKKQGMLLGAFDYLYKPVSIEELHHAFERIERFTNKKLKKLLIIEDNEQQNQAICELIGNGDVKSYSAYLGSQAYEMLESDSFDCIILDLGLPDMSGFDLMEKIRANEVLNKIPIVVYTGRDLKKEETARLTKLADTVVLKTANSHERLLDETILFLHRVESRLPSNQQKIIRKLHRTDEVLKDKKVLIVDDDIRNIYSLTNALEEEGLNCITAENGKVALEIVKADASIDLILMDVMMPEMDGYEATIEIRKLDQFKRLPIIALTAKAMKGDREKCLISGMSDYVSKPVNIAQLLSLMRVWLYR